MNWGRFYIKTDKKIDTAKNLNDLTVVVIQKDQQLGNFLKISIMEDKLITLKNYETVVEAMFDQELLRENNIESALNNEDAVELMPMFGEINEGLRLMVFEKDYEQSIKILEDYANAIQAE